MTPSEVARRLQLPANTVHYWTKKLEGDGLLEQVEALVWAVGIEKGAVVTYEPASSDRLMQISANILAGSGDRNSRFAHSFWDLIAEAAIHVFRSVGASIAPSGARLS